MDAIEREALLRAGLDPDADPDELADQIWVRDLLVCYGVWRRQWLGLTPPTCPKGQLTPTPSRSRMRSKHAS
ncbi:hypothetical protein ABIA39_007464 [Nocardia sp. GAS34]|uniref:hypothetical protein n=1 Tax=unclassified Nocardia TaxID=2637762 RepID=UPI003D1D746C